MVLIVRGECRPGADHAAGSRQQLGLQRAVLQPWRDRVDGACERGRIEAVGPASLACTKLASAASVASAMSRLRPVASLRPAVKTRCGYMEYKTPPSLLLQLLRMRAGTIVVSVAARACARR